MVVAAASTVLTVGIVVAVAEVRAQLAGWLDPSWGTRSIRFDPVLGWDNVPGFRSDEWGGLTQEELGCRSPEPTPGLPSVVLLGDSVAWGFGVADDDALGFVLERRLRSKGLQVRNLAVPGYGLDQAVLRLERDVAEIDDPEWVVLVICSCNDHADTVTNSAYGRRKPLLGSREVDRDLQPRSIRRWNRRNLLARSWTVEWLQGRWPASQAWIGWLAGDRWLPLDDHDAARAAWIRRLRRDVDRRDMVALAVISPGDFDFSEPSRFYERTTGDLEAAGIARVPMLEQWRAAGLGPSDMLIDGCHLAPGGSRRMADAIASAILGREPAPEQPAAPVS